MPTAILDSNPIGSTIELVRALLPAQYATIVPSLSREQETGDDTLMQQICRGAEWAIELLYQRYNRYAYALAYRIVHDSTLAEDIVQEAFFALWRKATLYQSQQGSVRSWLQAIVHHRAIDRVRSTHRNQQWVLPQTENEQEQVDEAPEAWEEVWQDELHTTIREILKQLPDEQRIVIELAYFEGYTHTQIAEERNIPLGTVKGRLRLGLRKMKQLLSEKGIETL